MHEVTSAVEVLLYISHRHQAPMCQEREGKWNYLNHSTIYSSTHPMAISCCLSGQIHASLQHAAQGVMSGNEGVKGCKGYSQGYSPNIPCALFDLQPLQEIIYLAGRVVAIILYIPL